MPGSCDHSPRWARSRGGLVKAATTLTRPRRFGAAVGLACVMLAAATPATADSRSIDVRAVDRAAIEAAAGTVPAWPNGAGPFGLVGTQPWALFDRSAYRITIPATSNPRIDGRTFPTGAFDTITHPDGSALEFECGPRSCTTEVVVHPAGFGYDRHTDDVVAATTLADAPEDLARVGTFELRAAGTVRTVVLLHPEGLSPTPQLTITQNNERRGVLTPGRSTVSLTDLDPASPVALRADGRELARASASNTGTVTFNVELERPVEAATLTVRNVEGFDQQLQIGGSEQDVNVSDPNLSARAADGTLGPDSAVIVQGDGFEADQQVDITFEPELEFDLAGSPATSATGTLSLVLTFDGAPAGTYELHARAGGSVASTEIDITSAGSDAGNGSSTDTGGNTGGSGEVGSGEAGTGTQSGAQDAGDGDPAAQQANRDTRTVAGALEAERGCAALADLPGELLDSADDSQITCHDLAVRVNGRQPTGPVAPDDIVAARVTGAAPGSSPVLVTGPHGQTKALSEAADDGAVAFEITASELEETGGRVTVIAAADGSVRIYHTQLELETDATEADGPGSGRVAGLAVSWWLSIAAVVAVTSILGVLAARRRRW